jgi:DNA mismatch repair protein MutH
VPPPSAEARRRGRAYAVAWEAAQDRRCLACGRWVSEAGTSGMDLRQRLRVCEPCIVNQAERRIAVLEAKTWAEVAAARALALSGAA